MANKGIGTHRIIPLMQDMKVFFLIYIIPSKWRVSQVTSMYNTYAFKDITMQSLLIGGFSECKHPVSVYDISLRH